MALGFVSLSLPGREVGRGQGRRRVGLKKRKKEVGCEGKEGGRGWLRERGDIRESRVERRQVREGERQIQRRKRTMIITPSPISPFSFPPLRQMTQDENPANQDQSNATSMIQRSTGDRQNEVGGGAFNHVDKFQASSLSNRSTKINVKDDDDNLLLSSSPPLFPFFPSFPSSSSSSPSHYCLLLLRLLLQYIALPLLFTYLARCTSQVKECKTDGHAPKGRGNARMRSIPQKKWVACFFLSKTPGDSSN